MTLWIAWSALISVFIAIAAVASARAGAYLRAPRRFVWMGAMIASTVIPLSLAFRTAPGINPSSLAQSRIDNPSVRVATGSMVASGRATTANQSVARVAVDSPNASSGSLSGGGSQWERCRHRILAGIATVELADPWVARAWALTSLILFLAFVRASVVLARRRSRWRDVEMDAGRVLVARDAGPAVIGFVHPRIVIPEWALSIERATRDLLLRHELEHIRAGDSRALLCAVVLVICAPWNAALWWMARQLRLAIEIDCDARVIGNGGETRDYALVLLAVGERYASAIPLAASLSVPRSNLEARIDAMTAPGLRRPVVASLPFVGLAVVVLATSAWVPRPMPLARKAERQVPSPETATAVLRDPKPLPGNPAPRYPDALRGNGTEGHVLLTFSTDARGVPDTATINVIESTNDQFASAIRRVLPNWRFDSAGRVRFAFRFMTLETQQKEAAARTSPTFTIEGVAVRPVGVVSATPANRKSIDVPQPRGIGAAGASPALRQFETRAELDAQAIAAEKGQRTEEARLLRSRLEKGDFQEGDRILVELEVANNTVSPDTLVVQNGKNGKHLGFAQMADLSLEGVLRAELQERLRHHLAQYLRQPLVVRVTPLVAERDRRDQQMNLSTLSSAAVDTIAARLASLEVQRLSLLATEPTGGAPQNDVELEIRSLREQIRRQPERDSANRVVDSRVAAALDARLYELQARLQAMRQLFIDEYPPVQNLVRALRLVQERKAEIRRTNP